MSAIRLFLPLDSLQPRADGEAGGVGRKRDFLSVRSPELRLFALLPVFSCAVLISSCSSVPREPKLPKVDYAAYEKVEESGGSKLIRVFTKLPGMKHHAHYGNWGGSGAEGGAPIDVMDELFRRHDICYDLCHSAAKMRKADEELVFQLKCLPPESLTKHGEKFKERAISYFGSPISKMLGKPIKAFCCKKEHPNGRFAKDGSVRVFMDPHVPPDQLKYH